MKEHPIQIEAVRVKDLYAFACRAAAQAKERDILPISRQRALAWSMNPYADANDEVLHVAYHQGQCVGYRGALPGRLKVRGASHKVFWTSTHFVTPEFRRYQVAVQLNKRAVSAANDSVVVGLSAAAEAFVRLVGWRRLGSVVVAGLYLDARRMCTMPLRLLNGRLRKVRGCEGISSAIDAAIQRLDRLTYPLERSLYYRILMLSTRRLRAGVRWREVSQFSAEDNIEALAQEPQVGFHRGLELINWMIRCPWLVERGQQPDDSERYRFSNVRDVFRYIPLLIYEAPEGAPVGFVVFSVSKQDSRTTFKVLDFGPSHPEACGRLVGLALKYASMWSADVIEMPPPVAATLSHNFWAARFVRTSELPCYYRAYDAASPLSVVASNLSVGHCDGDLAFT